jgi:hypothetical protein
MTPQECPIFQTCNAPVCPLDPAWRRACHLQGEQVCRYLLARDKARAREHYADDPTFAAVLEHAGDVCARHGDIARRVAKAAASGFRKPPPRPPWTTT